MLGMESHFLSFLSLLFIVNPFNGAVMFLELTRNYDGHRRKHSAFTAALWTASMLLFFSITGRLLFDLFGFTLSAFQVAGGIIIFSTARKMTQGQTPDEKQTPEETEAARTKEDIAIVPLATPMLVGPGAITNVLLNVGEMKNFALDFSLYCISIFLIAIIVYIALIQSHVILKRLGSNTIFVFTRLMGMAIMALGVQYVFNGLSGFISSLSVLK